MRDKAFKVQWFCKNLMQYLLENIASIRSFETSLNFKRIYKKNFGNIKFQGEFFQDMIAFMYLQKKKDGFYIDIGAHDGVSGSNTYIFEQIGWKGVCIEPQPDVFKRLRKYRKCDCYNVALSSKTEDNVNFFKAYYIANQLSGIDEGISESNRQWAKEFGKTEIIKVKTMTFDEIMANYLNVKHIDFMSLDVEGYEVPILETIDFQQYSFGILTIEKSNPQRIKELMKKNGYRFFMEIGADLIFISECVNDCGRKK